MKDKIRQNINNIIIILEDTKKEIVTIISNEVMKGNFIINEENQILIKTITETELKFKELVDNSEQIISIKEETPRILDNNTEIINESSIIEENSNNSNIKENIKEENIIIEEKVEDKEEEELQIKETDNNINPPQLLPIEENNKTNIEEENIYNKLEQIYDETNIIKNEEDNTIKDNNDLIEHLNEKVIISPKAEIIGQNIINQPELPFYGEVMNERRKPLSDFIYNKYRVMATHIGYNTSSDISIYVAPLQVKNNNPNVPIIVHAYSHGKSVTASSYDTKDTGHSIVAIEIDDFCLLVRGGFDANNKFTSYIMTTGISASQGDKINIISKEEGYTGNNPQGSGHIKFKDGDNVYEIFPLSQTDNEYLSVIISKEFIDYYVVAKNYGQPKIKIYHNGFQQEIVAGWSGEYFEAEII